MLNSNFDIIRKITGNKIVTIKANNFKEAIKNFGELYDMPDSEVNSIDKNDEDIFLVVSNDNKIEFCYVFMNAPYIEYCLNGANDLIRIEKKGGISLI